MRRKDKLSLYRKKRDFSVTPEPSGQAPASAGGGRFVIQMHAARRLHFDLRLETDGVYKSWAVTRGPSLDPKDRRLAVEVEDHPIEYGTFEGIIPAGEYGGGTVMLWDRGAWIPEGDPVKAYKKGHISFEFQGERLKGGYSLIRMADRDEGKGKKVRHNWLLIKKSDRFAKPGHGDAAIAKATSIKTGRTMRQIAEGGGPSWDSKARTASAMKKNVAAIEASAGGKRGKLPAFIEPVLTTLVDAPPGGSSWIHEVKFDGYRLAARIENGKVKLFTRSGLDWTRKFRTIANALATTRIKSGWLDGEVVVPDEKGLSSFSSLQRALSEGDDKAMVFYLFDLPYLNGRDLRDLPLIQRKQMLHDTLFANRTNAALAYSDHHEADGGDFFKAACNMALEGVVSKRKDSPYRSGRGRDWVKSKCVDRDEFVVGGYTPSRAGKGIGSLLVGHYEGKQLVYDGRAGTGYGAKQSLALEKTLRAERVDDCPFRDMERAYKTRAIWVKPKMVVEIDHRGRSSDGLLRQAAFVGLRSDKPAKQVDRSDRKKSAAEKGEPKIGDIKITHPDRVIDPTTGATKLDVAKYYARVAETLLLDLGDRPVAVVRCPDGITGQSFFQRHPQQTLAGRISTVKDPEDKEQLLCVRSAKDVITLVQFGVIEIHPWQTHIDNLDKADRFILDLDPAPDVPFEAVTLAAKLVRKRLEDLGLQSIVKTTGGKGLHVIVPLRPAASWPVAKGFAKAMADNLARDEPKIFIAKASKAARKGHIYIDYLRNDRGSTAVGAYCVRARPGLPVAMPLDWGQVTEKLAPADYNLTTVTKVALPKEWRDAQGWRQGLDAKRLRAVGMKKA